MIDTLSYLKDFVTVSNPETGFWLFVVMIGLFTAFIVVDVLIYLTGYQTLSQWVIKKARQSKLIAVLIILIIVLFAAWLIAHFELITIILEGTWES